MNDIEKLKFQTNIQNIKNHISNALLGHSVVRKGYLFLSGVGHYLQCSGCGEKIPEFSWKTSHHKEGCAYLVQEQSKKILEEWIK